MLTECHNRLSEGLRLIINLRFAENIKNTDESILHFIAGCNQFNQLQPF